MIRRAKIVGIVLIVAGSLIALAARPGAVSADKIQGAPFFNVRDNGARGDGTSLDTEAINKTIEIAASAGGGTVYFPAGAYLSFSIRLKSNITIYLDNGATLIAADPHQNKGA